MTKKIVLNLTWLPYDNVGYSLYMSTWRNSKGKGMFCCYCWMCLIVVCMRGTCMRYPDGKKGKSHTKMLLFVYYTHVVCFYLFKSNFCMAYVHFLTCGFSHCIIFLFCVVCRNYMIGLYIITDRWCFIRSFFHSRLSISYVWTAEKGWKLIVWLEIYGSMTEIGCFLLNDTWNTKVRTILGQINVKWHE